MLCAQMSTLRALFDAIGLSRDAQTFEDGKADKVNLVGRLTNWLEKPTDVKPAPASSQLLQLLGASKGNSSTGGAPAAALLKHLKRPRSQSTDGLSDAESDTAVDGAGHAASAASASASKQSSTPVRPDASDAEIEAHVLHLVRTTTRPAQFTMIALLNALCSEFGDRMRSRGEWVAGILKQQFFATDPAVLGLAAGKEE